MAAIASQTGIGKARLAIAAGAALLACGIGAAKTFDAFDPSDRQAPSQDPVVSLLETVTGPGAVKLAISENAGADRRFLVLVDSASTPAEGARQRLETILQAGAGFNADAGDVVDLQVYPFVAGGFMAAEPGAALEAVAYFALAGVIVWLGFLSAPPAVLARPRDEVEAPMAPLKPEIVEPRPANDAIDLAADKAAENPGEAASVIRAWLHGHDRAG